MDAVASHAQRTLTLPYPGAASEDESKIPAAAAMAAAADTVVLALGTDLTMARPLAPSESPLLPASCTRLS